MPRNPRRRREVSSDADYAHWGEEAAIIREREERNPPTDIDDYDPMEGE